MGTWPGGKDEEAGCEILNEGGKENRMYRKRNEKPLLERKREEEDKNVNRK